MKRYNPKVIEPKWQKIWASTKIYQATEDKTKPKRYVLEYFPYPSGAAMHVGHVRNYTIGDAIARYNRMKGNNVLYPMGWDAFGLPAENYAIKTGISPQAAVAKNVENFKQQLMQMGFSYDWSREINSTDPSYYKWTQWFFLLLLKRGLAYQEESLQWWCPFDKTVLANEQVENGHCWRCGNLVEKKSLKQWFFKITDYADRLAKDLDDVNWSEGIKQMQRNWIGRSQGAEINFEVEGTKEKLNVFTTRPDTLYGATFLVLAPEHKILNKLSISKEVKDYIEQAERKSEIDRMETEREKTGVFTGAYAINPANKEKIPIWIADYVLPGYGTGAIMAVPAHDERDWQFAKKFKLKITEVIAPHIVYEDIHKVRKDVETLKRHVVDAIIKNKKDEYLLLVEDNNNVHFVGGGVEPNDKDDVAAVIREVVEETGYVDIAKIEEVSSTIIAFGYRANKNKNQHVDGKFYGVTLKSDKKIKSEIDDGAHKIKWVKKEDVEKLITWEAHLLAWSQYLSGSTCYMGEGLVINSGKYNDMATAQMREKVVADLAKQNLAREKVNYKIRDWLISRQRYWGAPIPIIHCQKCGVVPVPEDQLPVQLPELKKFEPAGDGRGPLANVPEFVNVKCPKCNGKAERETDTMDGFACSSWYFLRFADPHNDQKAFAKAKVDFWLPVDDYIGGAEHAVMHLLYARFWTKVMFDEKLIDFDEPFKTLRNQGMILAPDGRKMSKSWNNTIEPDQLIKQGYGADSIRLMELFIGPWNQAANWNVEGLGGTFRFLQRVWTLVGEFLEAKEGTKGHNAELEVQITRLSHKAIKKVSQDMDELGFNTAIATLMETVNELYKIKSQHNFGLAHGAWNDALIVLTQLLAPFAPHIGEELWQELGQSGSVHVSRWPAWDKELIKEELITLAVQINGKLRAEILVEADVDEKTAIEIAKNDEKVAKNLAGKKVKKAIYVPGRLVSLVI